MEKTLILHTELNIIHSKNIKFKENMHKENILNKAFQKAVATLAKKL